jgi:ribose 5-phosphate isomerase RpiB
VSEESGSAREDLVRSVAIGSDHGAVEQKEMLVRYLGILGYRVVNVGCFGTDKVDYPDIATAVCRKLTSGDCERGIILDGAGGDVL